MKFFNSVDSTTIFSTFFAAFQIYIFISSRIRPSFKILFHFNSQSSVKNLPADVP